MSNSSQNCLIGHLLSSII